jgi:hypothetical protein
MVFSSFMIMMGVTILPLLHKGKFYPMWQFHSILVEDPFLGEVIPILEAKRHVVHGASVRVARFVTSTKLKGNLLASPLGIAACIRGWLPSAQ